MSGWVRIEISEKPGRQDQPSFVLQHQLAVDCAVRVPYGDEYAAATTEQKAAFGRYAKAVAPHLRRLADSLER